LTNKIKSLYGADIVGTRKTMQITLCPSYGDRERCIVQPVYRTQSLSLTYIDLKMWNKRRFSL